MFEPACRGGSRRSLSISNPTPIWPRYPSEMVSASALPRTHFHTNAQNSRLPCGAGPPLSGSYGRGGFFSLFAPELSALILFSFFFQLGVRFRVVLNEPPNSFRVPRRFPSALPPRGGLPSRARRGRTRAPRSGGTKRGCGGAPEPAPAPRMPRPGHPHRPAAGKLPPGARFAPPRPDPRAPAPSASRRRKSCRRAGGDRPAPGAAPSRQPEAPGARRSARSPPPVVF